MLADQYDLAVSTVSEAARDAYVQGCELALTFYPGAIEAFDRATADDPNFSLPHAAKAQVLMREGNVAAARAALVAAKDLAAGLSQREASHIAYFDLAFAGRTDAAIDALYARRAEAPDRRADGQSRPPLQRRFLVSCPSCHGAFRGRAARGGAPENRALGGDKPEQRTWRARVRARLLRERRGGHRPRLSRS